MSTWTCVSTTKIAHATIAIERILIVAGVKKGAATGRELRLRSLADRAAGLQFLQLALDRDGIDVRLEASFAMAALGMEPVRLEQNLGAWRTEGTRKGVAMTPDDAWCSTTTRGVAKLRQPCPRLEQTWRSFAGRVRFPPVSFVCSFFFFSSRFDFGAIENRQSLALRDSGAAARSRRGWQQRVWRAPFVVSSVPGLANSKAPLPARRTAISCGVRPRPDCSWASSRLRSHMRTRSLPGSFRARTSLRTRPEPLVGRLSETAAIACLEN